jgi:xylulose-5-phosphate/fructose-6-phosphate phosphoketolase
VAHDHFAIAQGLDGTEEVDGKKTEGFWRSHQVPFAELASKPDHIKLLEDWMKSYKPEELFDEHGKLIDELAELAPQGHRRMGDNPHANGGILLRDLKMPDFQDYAVEVTNPGTTYAEATRVMGHCCGM